MADNDQLYQLGLRAWEFRKQFGFSKALPEEIRTSAAEISRKGASLLSVAKALGVSKATVSDWKTRYAQASAPGFSEVQVVESKPVHEIKLSTQVQGCRVELTGSDFSLLQRLVRKISS